MLNYVKKCMAEARSNDRQTKEKENAMEEAGRIFRKYLLHMLANKGI